MPDNEHLTQDLSTLDSLIPHVAVLGSDGTILATNDSWNRFAQENGAARMTATGPGTNYLSVCRRAASEGVSDAEAALEGIRGVLEGRRGSFQLEYSCNSLTGERWFLMSVSPLTGSTGRAVVTQVDVTDRKFPELAVRSSELSLLDCPPHSIVGVGADGKIAQVSGNTLKMFGCSRDDLRGQPQEVLVPESARMHHVQHRQHHFDDIEVGLAKEKLETVGALAQGIAHDFNNLLAGVLAHTELAQAEIAEGSNPAEELRKIQTAVLHGTELVRQLMIYAGQERQALESINISAIAENMLALLRVSVSKRVTVQSELCGDLPAVRANPSQIRQLLMNLFSNASDAIGDRDGLIRVTTAPVGAGYVMLEVTDTGRGMTPELQERIFEPFFTTKPTGSHGHGLVVVKRLVERLRGTIRLSSTPGSGTTFQILLPCEPGSITTIPDPATRAANEKIDLPRKTVLVVEDENLLREAVSKMLRKHALTVLEAADGSAALDLIRAQKDYIDLLFLDITLPGASSRDVYELAMGLKPGLPVIVTSAKTKEVSTALLATGIDNFLRKPYPIADLIQMIQGLLSPSSAGR